MLEKSKMDLREFREKKNGRKKNKIVIVMT